MFKLFKVVAVMVAAHYLLIAPIVQKVTVQSDSFALAAIIGVMAILAITIPFIVK